MKPVKFFVEAQAEFHEGIAWYEGREPGLGEEFRAAVLDKAAEIGADPERFAPALDAGDVPPGAPAVRHAFLRRFRYKLVFSELPEEVRVVAVAHLSRKPDTWKDRLPKS